MKVVTVRQPFASLMAAGAKTLLDQAHPTGYRGRLLIRSGSTTPPATWPGPYLLATSTSEGGFGGERFALLGAARDHGPLPLPLGVVVASCELVDCVPTDALGWCSEIGGKRGWTVGLVLDDDERDSVLVSGSQLPFGDFAPGRWVWLLDDVRPTTERCPRCWGEGWLRLPRWKHDGEPCRTCMTRGTCPPVWMRGGPGLRTPEWETT